MKLNKIIGISVATLGVAFAFAGSAALYTKSANDAKFNFGAGSWGGSDGTINYKINGATGAGTVTPSYLKTGGDNGGTGFGGEYTQAHYAFTLGASFADGMPDQNFVVGNFKVEVTNIAASLQNAAKIYIGINGYVASSVGEVTYQDAFMSHTSEGDTFTSDSYEKAADIGVSSSGTQTVNIYIKLDAAVSDEALALLDEGKAFDIKGTWGAASESYKHAYVLGNGNMWAEDPKFAMTPNINKANSEGFEWIYNGLAGSIGEAKCRKGDDWSKGDNFPCVTGTTYDVYWSGSAAAAATFTARAA